ncbi:fumarylacetoacetate hydrolase family protein [Sphingomonas sp. MMS24-JH45]
MPIMRRRWAASPRRRRRSSSPNGRRRWCLSGGTIAYPPQTHDYHHEVELVVALASGGRDIAEADALDHVFGYAVGLDMTRRDLQAEAKAKGRPWDVAKNVEQSAPLGPIAAGGGRRPPCDRRDHADVNGEERQRGDLSDLMLGVPALIAHLSRFYTLAAGDLVFTGTPAGVGPVAPGDVLVGAIAGLDPLQVTIGEGPRG